MGDIDVEKLTTKEEINIFVKGNFPVKEVKEGLSSDDKKIFI